MKDKAKYDVNDAPISGPFAGLDPEQQPVIVDPKGERMSDDPNTPGAPKDGTWSAYEDERIVDSLITLCMTHTVQIETAPVAPVHRIVIGGAADMRPPLLDALNAAVKHHKGK